MHLPRRTVKSIQPLPSIHTAFPLVKSRDNDSIENSGKCLIRNFEDGIEVVPFERRNDSAPILSPDQGDKEVLLWRKSPLDKPLPKPPQSLWARLSMRKRMLAIIGVQCALLLTVGLALMAAKRRSSSNGPDPTARVSENDSPIPQAIGSIPTGSYAVPIRTSQTHDSACLAMMNESIAWQCASDTTLQLNILPPYTASNNNFVQLTRPSSLSGIFYPGHQAPDIQPVELRKAMDIEGPIYHFNATYNHVVLLREEEFTTIEQPAESYTAFRNEDTLWRCAFNQVKVEGCIFVDLKTKADQALNNTTFGQPQSLPKIPNQLKLVEQRVPNGKGAYCEKMKVQGSTLVASPDKKQALTLADPKAEAEAAKPKLIRSTKFQIRQQVPGSKLCRCQWKVE